MKWMLQHNAHAKYCQMAQHSFCSSQLEKKRAWFQSPCRQGMVQTTNVLLRWYHRTRPHTLNIILPPLGIRVHHFQWGQTVQDNLGANNNRSFALSCSCASESKETCVRLPYSYYVTGSTIFVCIRQHCMQRLFGRDWLVVEGLLCGEKVATNGSLARRYHELFSLSLMRRVYCIVLSTTIHRVWQTVQPQGTFNQWR